MLMLLLFIGIAIFFSFLCSIAEAVLLSITPAYVAASDESGSAISRTMKKMRENVDTPLAAILSLNTIAHTLGAAGAGSQATKLFGNEYLGIISAILTILILVFSEIIPKTLGATYWRALAPITCVFLKYLIVVLYPLVIMSKFITRMLKRDDNQGDFTLEEFRAMAKVGKSEGDINDKELRVLTNLFEFRDHAVKEVLIPRVNIIAIQKDMTISDFVKNLSDYPYSRIPIYSTDKDSISGYIKKERVLTESLNGNNDKPVHTYAVDIPKVYENTTLPVVFESLLENKSKMALVKDMDGGVEGIVTIVDIVQKLLWENVEL